MDSKLLRRSAFIGALLAASLGSATAFTWTQATNAADGPWSGWAQCVIKTTATNYEETQTHTWRITGGAPRVTGSTRHWPAVWSVQGTGQRLIASTNPGAAVIAANTGGPSESWTITVPEKEAPIAFWEIPATGQLRIGSQHAQLSASGAITVNASSGQSTPPGSLGEWQFPSITGSTTAAAVKTDTPTNRGLVIPYGWQRPHQALTTETCAWDFAKGATQSSAPPAPGTLGRINAAAADAPTFGPGRSQQAAPPSTGVAVSTATPPATPPPGTPPPSPPPGVAVQPPSTPPPSPPPGVAVQPPSTPPPPPPSGTPPPPPSATPAPTLRALPTQPPSTPPTTSPATPPSGTPVTSPPPAAPPPGSKTIVPRPLTATPPAPAPSTTPSAPSSATPTAPRSGTYLVTITGLICGQPTQDSPVIGIDPDGKGDEVYAAAYVRRFNRTSTELLEHTVRQTIPYGDVTNYGTSRLQAGTQTPTGGVRAGDWVPGTFSIARNFPAQESAFPFRVWQGQLTDTADALLISPMVWEHDGGNSIFQQWVQSQGVLNNTILMNASVQARAGSRTFGTLEVGAIDPQTPDLLSTIINGRQDGPLGVRQTGGIYSIPNITVVLTREIIEQALSSQWATMQPSVVPGQMLSIPKPGILVVNFANVAPSNVPGGRASYTLILQVERVGG